MFLGRSSFPLGGAMLRLTYDDRHEQQDPTPDSYLFPTEAARYLRRGNRFESAPTDTGTCDAARRVERAMREVELRFDRLRGLFGTTGGDPDRPRAA